MNSYVLKEMMFYLFSNVNIQMNWYKVTMHMVATVLGCSLLFVLRLQLPTSTSTHPSNHPFVFTYPSYAPDSPIFHRPARGNSWENPLQFSLAILLTLSSRIEIRRTSSTRRFCARSHHPL